jgi:hypothetical protein
VLPGAPVAPLVPVAPTAPEAPGAPSRPRISHPTFRIENNATQNINRFIFLG